MGGWVGGGDRASFFLLQEEEGVGGWVGRTFVLEEFAKGVEAELGVGLLLGEGEGGGESGVVRGEEGGEGGPVLLCCLGGWVGGWVGGGGEGESCVGGEEGEGGPVLLLGLGWGWVGGWVGKGRRWVKWVRYVGRW